MRSDPATMRPRFRAALLAGASVPAITVGAGAWAAIPLPPSQAQFAARVDASVAATAAAAASPMNALRQVTAATRNLATLAARLQTMRTVQAAAATAAQALAGPGPVPNGSVAGGLLPAQGATAGSGLWLGADLPGEGTPTAAGRVAVTVKQTAPQAVLTWQSFNVGVKTELAFDQSAGLANASNWVVLNRIEDVGIAPTTILGSIKAPGKVFVINAAGIIFGAGAQVNVGSLIASTADISAAQFGAGIYGAPSGSGFVPSFTGATAGIVVAQGASIATNAPSAVAEGGGYAMLLGSTVENDGDIETPEGQTVLAAGQDFILRAGYSSTSNQTATVLGSQVATTGKIGSAVNDGLIVATHGDVTLVAPAVAQNGVAIATSSVNTRGTVHLLNDATAAGGSVTLGPDSVTVVNPDDAATTALDSQRTSLLVQSAANNALRGTGISSNNPQLGDVGTLPDLLDEGRVEIVTGGTASFQGGSLTMSQGGQIAVQAGSRAWLGDGAALDVSGSTNAVLPITSNVLTVSIQGNELRDAPVNRDTGAITSTTVSVDARQLIAVAAGTGGDANARAYTAGGLLEVSGYLSNVGHTIDEWAAPGGTVTLASNEVVTQPQALLNVSGGGVSVLGGSVPQSYLIGADGHLYNVNTAPATIQYVGVYGGFTVDYPRWGFSDTFRPALGLAGSETETGYVYGRDAGSVVVSAPTAVLEGQIDAGVVNGAQQTAVRQPATDSYARPQSAIALPGTLAVGGYTPASVLLAPNVTVADGIAPVADTIAADTRLPNALGNTVQLSASQLNAEQLGGLSVVTAGRVEVDAPLVLAPGGSIALTGSNVMVAADLTARGGRIALSDIATDPTGIAHVLVPKNGSSGGVAITSNATLDLRGVFTNATLSPGDLSGEGLVNGGALVVDAAQDLAVDPGTVIDASSGGAVLPGNKTRGGAGGSVTLVGADPFYNILPTKVVIAPTLRDYGVAGGGTLTLTAPFVVVTGTAYQANQNRVVLTPDVFMSGFSSYVVNGFRGLQVTPGTVVTVAEPVLSFQPAGSSAPVQAPSGEDPEQALQLILPPSYAEDRATGRLTQRQGASVAFLSSDRPGAVDLGGGDLTIGAGASIGVDAGRSVRLEAYGEIVEDGAIGARGGSVAIVNTHANMLPTDDVLKQAQAMSIWIGSSAVIDVSGLATTALDEFGRPYGVVTAGGTIAIGGTGAANGSGALTETDEQVLIRPGAVLDASGAAATIDLLAGSGPVLDVSTGAAATDPVLATTGGGGITLGSYDGIAIDGVLRAAAGGAGAAGGTLSLVLEDPTYAAGVTVPEPLQRARIVTVSQLTEATTPDPDLAPLDPIPHEQFGHAAISQQQLDEGGFAALSVYARDAIQFDGSVALHLAGSVTLNQGILSDTVKDAAVSIAAPYVHLSGHTPVTAESGYTPTINNTNWHAYDGGTPGSFSVQADLIDVDADVRFGVSTTITVSAGTALPGKPYDLPGFGVVTLQSTGDVRFGTGSLTTPGDLNLVAAQIYPTTGAALNVFAGFDQYAQKGVDNIFQPDGAITIGTGGAATPAVPYSVGGQLGLYAGAIVQGGVIRAPEGTLTLGAVGIGPAGVPIAATDFRTSTVDLLAGSITSVSLENQTIPYGGTVDGVSYTVNGAPASTFNPTLTLAGQVQTVAAGALLNLGGGGSLAGAGFITGRGGSTDVLTTPLLQFDAVTRTVSTASPAVAPIYAIVPSYASAYAPTATATASGAGGPAPAIGSRIVIGAGVPGIAPGTYTLLPARYALLPGAARVQINLGRRDLVPGVSALGAGSYELNATTLVANTGVAAAVPVDVIVTTGAGVLANSQYNQESYSAYQIAQAANFGAPRANLPEDGKTLSLIFPQQAPPVNAFNFAGVADFAPVAGARGGQVDVGAKSDSVGIEIVADGATAAKGFTTIEASQLDALGAARLVIGGSLAPSPSLASELDFKGTVGEVVVRSGAVLAAPEVFLVTGQFALARQGAITVESGAIIDTLGEGAAPTDSSQGFVYNAFGATVIAASNGNLVFERGGSSPGIGAITVADGASLFAGGTLNFLTGNSLVLSSAASYAARYLSLSLNTINVVSDAALAAQAAGTLVLPSGFVLTQAVLDALLAGDPASGKPALTSLILTANGSINFAGSVALDATGAGSQLGDLTLNTPAIYGAGGVDDVATISAGTLYWNGIETATTVGTTKTTGSALPGGVVADGPGTGAGTLNITAQNIVLGYGPNTQADDQTTLNRVIEGFATVNLTASQSISANNRGTLAVYQTAGDEPGAPGTGGTLNLTTPLLTGAANSVDGITAGGLLTLAGTAAATVPGSLGAEIDLAANAITVDSAIQLNAGRLMMTAASDIIIGADARIDLAGRSITLVDQVESTGGGAVVLEAGAGSINAAAGSVIDVSAGVAAGGSLSATAMAGAVDLSGIVLGNGGTGQAGGRFSLRTGTLADFDTLNDALDTGGFTFSRAFQIGAGNLLVDRSVTAHHVSIAVDAGSLEISGAIEASGAAPGSITLSAGGGLTLDDGAVLNAAGTVLQHDSFGAQIDAENRATVSLTAANGVLSLGAATFDVSAPVVDAHGKPENIGVVDLVAPQIMTGGQYDDVALQASGAARILGAGTIAVYASRTYQATDANGTISQDGDAKIPGSVSLNAISDDNAAFLADADGRLAGRIAPLVAAYGGAVHLRPDDIIVSGNASGLLTVDGDLDLSTLRYGPGVGSGVAGAGEVGMLTLRAANTLTVNGSISDGFAAPSTATHNPDNNGWLLYATEPLGQAVTLPQTLTDPITLKNGSTISTRTPVALNYGITIAQTTLKANVVIPTHVVTAVGYKIPAGGVTATATITGPDGVVIAARGTIMPAGFSIPKGSKLDQGTVLPFTVAVAEHTVWPKGTTLSVFVATQVTLDYPHVVKGSGATVAGSLQLHGGAYIPAGSVLKFDGRAASVMVRDVHQGVQGRIYATAAMLPAGSQSWSINLVGGADLASADVLAVQPRTALGDALRGEPDPAGSVVLSDTHYTEPGRAPTSSFSVVRTGTGTLNVVAGGNVDEASLFGVYTAGTDTSLGEADAQYQTPRATLADGTVLGAANSKYNAADALYRAYYPGGGGDVLVSAQNSVLGDVIGGISSSAEVGTDNVGNWLWRQGGAGIGQQTAWSINFGSYVLPLNATGSITAPQPILAGFTGFGALGGGNVTVVAGGDAGQVTTLPQISSPVSQGLVIAVASTGRVTGVDVVGGSVTGGTTELTGGGTLTLNVGGTLNPAVESGLYDGLGGTLTDMRGNIIVTAGQVGRLDLRYDLRDGSDPRPQDPFATSFATSTNGLIVVPGDGGVAIDALRDLVLAGAGDAGRMPEQSLTAIGAAYLPKGKTVFAGNTGFSLWTASTAIDLFSAGGNVTPTTQAAGGVNSPAGPSIPVNDLATDYRFLYPGTLNVVAASGSLYYGPVISSSVPNAAYALELAPSASGQLSFIAANSIYAHGYSIDMSGANDGPNWLPNPYNPAYTDSGIFGQKGSIENFLGGFGHTESPNSLFAFEADTPTSDLHGNDMQPALFYAAAGDIVDFQFGEILIFPIEHGTPDWYIAAKPGWIVAGRDIVSAGTRPSVYPDASFLAGTFGSFPNTRSVSEGGGPVPSLSAGSLLLNDRTTDVSLVSAGRDILSSYVYIAGPGSLQVNAGRNIDQTGDANLKFGVLRSIGQIIDINASDRSGGANISVLNGTGASGPAITTFADLYLNDANMADLSIPLNDPRNNGKVQQTYQQALYAWLRTYYGYAGLEANAPQAFSLLPQLDQAVFVRSVFFNELLASGRQHSDASSLFFGSYLRGETAIATLLPTKDAANNPIVYGGNLTMDSGTLPGIFSDTADVPPHIPAVFDSGISTLLGGNVQILSPGGGDVLGVAGGAIPGANSGILTFGSGNIDIYALNSVLLGQSRIFTTFGGNILIWSADGDINAGRGAKTTTVQQPQLIAYDPYGGITLSPSAPTSGAGIATLAPIAGTTPGDVDLIAPLGTVDAGEAGIRVSGNLNIAAQSVLNAANVQVSGKTTGSTAGVVVNTAAVSAASNVAGSAVNAATNANATRRQAAPLSPSIITVQILDASNTETRRRRRPAA